MPVYILTGPDAVGARARSDQLLGANTSGGANLERFDLTEDGGAALASSASTGSLFGGPRGLLAHPAGALTPQSASDLLEFTLPEVTVVLTDTAALTPSARKALAGATFEHFADPTARDAATRVADAARAQGLTLDASASAALAELAPSRWSLVQGALVELANLGVVTVDVEDVRKLTGTAASPATPWTLAAAIEAGDLREALTLTERLEALSTIAYLAKRLAGVGRLLDGSVTEVAAARDVLGGGDTAARSALELSRRLTAEQVSTGWDLLAEADRSAKTSPTPHDVLTVLVTRLATLWGRATAAL